MRPPKTLIQFCGCDFRGHCKMSVRPHKLTWQAERPQGVGERKAKRIL
jgi:hypothetical protein